ncbi:hypothetical protein B0O80DRAFT_496757 [Mortierella sp. GBAus27b]|nr:hypothetical protein BGX31_008327 [Mortierella sp. GBA43]KAI8357032.1 hypothetical protein B0O80DRAFT_496757 [Mortierella sp. GBAus27b]
MFAKDCAELIKALGSFDYACANRHMLRISKAHPTVGSICSRIIQCEGHYSSMQFLKPNKLFRRDDNLDQLYNEIASDVDRECFVYREASVGVYGSVDTDTATRTVGGGSGRQGGTSGQSSPVLAMSEASQSSIHQYISSNHPSVASTGGHTRPTDIVISGGGGNSGNTISLSPSFNSQYVIQGGSYNGREDQSAADHVVFYTLLRELCSLRVMLIRIYRSMSLSIVDIDVDHIMPDAEQALRMFDSESTEIHNSVLGVGIGHEIRVLMHGLLMDKAVSEYDIQKSSTHLHLARGSILEWRRISSEQEYADKTYHRPEETSWRYNLFGGSLGNLGNSSGNNSNNSHGHHSHHGSSSSGHLGEDTKSKSSSKNGRPPLQLPNHFQWLNRWIISEKAKMTLYFMDTLLEKEQALGGDERSLWAGIDPDMHGMIRTFRRKAGAHSISFVYEVPPDIRFSTSGFVSANAPYEPPTGLNSFPCIYSYPPDPPRDHWPNIISIMQGSVSILRQFRSQYFYDRKIGCTYYVARADHHVSIVIIYLDKHPQPDTGAMEFLQLLAGKLRHTEVLSAMRPE